MENGSVFLSNAVCKRSVFLGGNGSVLGLYFFIKGLFENLVTLGPYLDLRS